MAKEILVVGSIAFDSVKTPSGEADRVLGGSVNYFSIGASILTPVKMIGVVGEDFPEDHIAFLNARGIDTSGLKRTTGKTFYWKGEYEGDLSEAKTLRTDLNVFESFDPRLSDSQKKVPYIFLANIDPELQQSVLDQAENPQLVAMDTMNFWITGDKLPEVQKALKRIDILSINEGEALLLSKENSLKHAAEAILKMGPSVLVIKRGETGSALFCEQGTFLLPAYPVQVVKDPTGAGDTFAAGMMGYLAQKGVTRDDQKQKPDVFFRELKEALVTGSVLASFTIEEFSIDRLKAVEPKDLENRKQEFIRMLSLN